MIDFSQTPEINSTATEQRVKEIIKSEVTCFSGMELNKFILSSIDLTSLEGSDTSTKIIDVCNKAKSFHKKHATIPNVAAVCVYPTLVHIVKKELKNTGIKTASVAGAFPSGQSPLPIKLSEVRYAIDEGADEIDMVISRGKLLEGNYNAVFDEIAAIKDICKNNHLKVILETGELESLTNVRRASEIAMHAGADFIKTSTGKINRAATPEAMLTMLEAIKEYYIKTHKKVGIKPAGGISELVDAKNYVKLTYTVLGNTWLNNSLFRIGASRLADNVMNEIVKGI